jgi:hypothetical protein
MNGACELKPGESMIAGKSDRARQRLQLSRYIVTTGCRYLWQCLKNCVKFLIGRKLKYDHELEFYRKYILHLTGLSRIRGMTCANLLTTVEGPGSQASCKMCTMNAARLLGLTYVHTPFTATAHADRPMQEWAATWEQVFGLGVGEVSCDAGKRGVINSGNGLKYLELCFGRSGLRSQLIDSFVTMIPEFRRKYYWNKSPRTTRDLTVAVHVRRGDVSAGQYSYMFTETEKVLQIVRSVLSMLDSCTVPVRLSVYSQGDKANFARFSQLGVELFLDADPAWTMQELVEADILIVAKSSFSYYSGLISDGIKIFEPIGEPGDEWVLPGYVAAWGSAFFSRLEDWIPCQEDGSIDRAAFERQLASLLQAKREALSVLEDRRTAPSGQA